MPPSFRSSQTTLLLICAASLSGCFSNRPSLVDLTPATTTAVPPPAGGGTSGGVSNGRIYPDTSAFTQYLLLDVEHSTLSLNTTQFGLSVEDASHAGEGGLHANMVRNPTMKEGGTNPPASWSVYSSGGGTGKISLDLTGPLSLANDRMLRLDITSNGSGQRVGVANTGFYGVGLRPNTSYTVSFYVRAANFAAPLRVTLEGVDGTVHASADVTAPSSSWALMTATLNTDAATLASTANLIVISAEGAGSGGSLWFDLVQCMGPVAGTNTPLRADLAGLVAGAHPGFMRFPSGFYLEGFTPYGHFNWKSTVGKRVDRTGHQNDAWGYWSSDAMGLLEYLELAEQAGAEPLLVVYAGHSSNGNVVAAADLPPYVQDALDEIDYVSGNVTTPWGAQRAADGHPAPFALHYVEIGSEDVADASGSYNTYRFPMFYDAMKAAHPTINVVASRGDTFSRVPDAIDDRFFQSPAWFAGANNYYDTTSRMEPLHLVGGFSAYSSKPGNPTGALAGALGEAAFLLGTQRNADVVLGAAYAPVLANVSDYQLSPNLIGFDALTAYVSPSYYVQQLLGTLKGDYGIPVQGAGMDAAFSWAASRAANGDVFLTLVNPTPAPFTVQILVSGSASVGAAGTATVLAGDPNAINSLTNPQQVPAPTSIPLPVSPSFPYTFAAHALTVLRIPTSGDSAPVLPLNRGVSWRSGGVASRQYSMVAQGGVVTLQNLSAASDDANRMAATFVTRPGLASARCVSFESRALPGHFLRQLQMRVELDATDGTAGFAADATFCPQVGHSGRGMLLQSFNFPTRYMRQYQGAVWLAQAGGGMPSDTADGFAEDTSWAPLPGLWRSDLNLSVNTSYTLTSSQSPTLALLQQQGLGVVNGVSNKSSAVTRQSATFTLVTGLADSSCYSFVAYNSPGVYLRHQGFRIKANVNDGSSLFASDATFCARAGSMPNTVTWIAYGYPDHALRMLAQDAWVASDRGDVLSDSAINYANDTSWVLSAPLAP